MADERLAKVRFVKRKLTAFDLTHAPGIHIETKNVETFFREAERSCQSDKAEADDGYAPF